MAGRVILCPMQLISLPWLKKDGSSLPADEQSRQDVTTIGRHTMNDDQAQAICLALMKADDEDEVVGPRDAVKEG